MPNNNILSYEGLSQIWPQYLGNEILSSADLNREMILRLLIAAEYRDDDTGRHVVRVGKYSRAIAEGYGIKGEFLDLIEIAAPMHDIGKIGIPDRILLKPGKLDDNEFEHMRKHTNIGAKILNGSKFPLLNMAHAIALSHHEKWDGTGYPLGLKGDAIPLSGRIAGLADVFDAMLSKRPYKEPLTWEASLDHVKKESGTHFDPDVFKAFIGKLSEIKIIYEECRDDSKCTNKCDLHSTYLRR